MASAWVVVISRGQVWSEIGQDDCGLPLSPLLLCIAAYAAHIPLCLYLFAAPLDVEFVFQLWESWEMRVSTDGGRLASLAGQS